MRISDVSKRLDSLILDLGFNRHSLTWNRQRGQFVDVIDLQQSKSKNLYTINMGVFSLEIFSACWIGERIADVIPEPSCIVRRRLGEVAYGSDYWWNLDHWYSVDDVVKWLKKSEVKFFARIQNMADIITHLEADGARTGRYPLPAIYLAIALIKNKQSNAGCDLLNLRKDQANEAWRTRIDAVASLLCRS